MFDPDHIDYDDVEADIEAAAEQLDAADDEDEDEDEFDPFADPADSWDRAYDMWLDRKLGID